MIRTLLYGDLYKNWETLLRVTGVTDASEGHEDRKTKRFYVTNILLCLFMAFCTFRIFITGLLALEPVSRWGYITAHSGNARNLLGAQAAVIYFQSIFYRIGIMQLVYKKEMYIMRSLKAIASCTKEVRETKERQARIILVAAVLGIMNMTINCICVVIGIFVVNVLFSDMTVDVLWWCFWLPNDFMLVTQVGVDLMLFPCLWILVALNYRTDLILLLERIDEMANQSNPIASTAVFREVYLTYFRLKAKADLTNRMSAPILWSLTFCTTPIVVLETFIGVHSDNTLFRVCMPVLGFLVAVFAFSLLLMAANVTTLAEQVHSGLCCASARNQKKWTVKHRLMMLNLMQDAGSADPPLAMYTTTGDKYTSESLLYYTLETVVNYMLLVTLKNSILL